MQMMVIEFARNVLGMENAKSREFALDGETAECANYVIDLMEEQKNISQMGGTMRLGAYDCELKSASRAAAIYGKTLIRERHRHRYEFNNAYQDAFEAKGMMCSGRNPDAQLVEIVELSGHRWYIGTQFHPEYQSTVLHPHPLFMDFIKTAIGK